MSSSRLPGKVLADINGTPLIEILLKRLSKAQLVDEVIVAMSTEQSDDVLEDFIASIGYRLFRGSINDVRSRYLDIARTEEADCIVRITGDCPLVDPKLVDKVISTFLISKVDYVSNIDPPTYPDGLDVEVFSAAALAKSASTSKSAYDKEHVTPNLRTEKFSHVNVINDENLSNLRWTVDTITDLEVVSRILIAFPEPLVVEFHDIVELCKKYPEMYQKNQMTKMVYR
jgi:glutamate-1-semialdehyde 2,1-aminomutase